MATRDAPYVKRIKFKLREMGDIREVRKPPNDLIVGSGCFPMPPTLKRAQYLLLNPYALK